MAKRTKIAPALRLVVGYDRPGPVDPTIGEARQAFAELRALIAVARAAAGVRRYVLEGGYENMEGPADKALFRALARLDRVSREGR